MIGDTYRRYVSPKPVAARLGDTYLRYMSPPAQPFGPPFAVA